jgi:hypothetical protein
MRYFFHIFDGSELHPDDVGNNLPSLEYARRLAEVVADELKKGGDFSRSSLVIVATRMIIYSLSAKFHKWTRTKQKSLE